MKLIRIRRKSKSHSISSSKECPTSEELSGALSSIDESELFDTFAIGADDGDTPTFKAFMKENGNVYPYNEVFKTKKEFHVKWLLSDTEQSGKHNKHGRRESLNKMAPVHSSHFDEKTVHHHTAGIHSSEKISGGKVYLTLANTIDNDTVQQLILSKQVYPVPPPMERILDAMRKFETDQDRLWYKKVLDYFFSCLKFEIKYDDVRLAKDSIEYRVCGVIRRELRHSTTDEKDFNKLVNDWRLWFDLQYQLNDNYLDLAEESVQYINKESFMASTKISKDWDK